MNKINALTLYARTRVKIYDFIAFSFRNEMNEVTQ